MEQSIPLGACVNDAGGTDFYSLRDVSGRKEVWVVLDLNKRGSPTPSCPVPESEWSKIDLGGKSLAEAVLAAKSES